MNPSDWTNAIKAAVIALVNSFMGLVGVVIIIAGVDLSTQDFAMLSLAIETFVNALLGIWILFTYRQSPTRATDSILKSRNLTP